MRRSTIHAANPVAPPPYQVEAPRPGDAIGLALRDAFDETLGLPEEMVAMLRRLNGATTRGAH